MLALQHSPTACDKKRPTIVRKPDNCLVPHNPQSKTFHRRLNPHSRTITFIQIARTNSILTISYKSLSLPPLARQPLSKMRSSTFLATMIAFMFALLAPAMAQESSWSSNSYTTTMTITLVQANATSYVHYTSTKPSVGTATMSATATGASGYSSPSLSAMPSATPSICTNCMGSGAGTQHSNLLAVGFAGAAALFWSTL